MDLQCVLSAYTEAKRPPKFVTNIDYLTSGLREVSKNTAIHTEEVLICRVVLDVLGMDRLQQHVDDDIERDLYHGRLKSLRELGRTVLRDSTGSKPAGYFISVLESRLSKGKPASHNPIFLGMVLMNVVERLSADDLNTVNLSGHLLQVAHVYIADLVRRGSKATRWPDMDALIALQKVEIFAGEPPTTHNQQNTRYYLALGLKPSEIRVETKSGYKRCRIITESRKTARSIIEEAKANRGDLSNEEYQRCFDSWLAKRNTPGWRREMYIPPLMSGKDSTEFQQLHGSSERTTIENGEAERSSRPSGFSVVEVPFSG